MPGAFILVCGAETYQRVLDRNFGQRLASHDYKKMLGRRSAVELKPAQPLVGFHRRRDIDGNMSGDPVVTTFQSRIRKDHFGRAVAFGMKDIEIAVDIRLERNANAIAVMKFAGWFDAQGAAVHVAQIERVAETDRFSGRRRVRVL